MPQPLRNTGEMLRGGYSYSFNGMETDHEVSGHGNSYTTQFRQYDPRLGRWKSLDPLAGKYSSESPYTGLGNNPIVFTDEDGDDIIFGKEINANPVLKRIAWNELLMRMNYRALAIMETPANIDAILTPELVGSTRVTFVNLGAAEKFILRNLESNNLRKREAALMAQHILNVGAGSDNLTVDYFINIDANPVDNAPDYDVYDLPESSFDHCPACPEASQVNIIIDASEYEAAVTQAGQNDKFLRVAIRDFRNHTRLAYNEAFGDPIAIRKGFKRFPMQFRFRIPKINLPKVRIRFGRDAMKTRRHPIRNFFRRLYKKLTYRSRIKF